MLPSNITDVIGFDDIVNEINLKVAKLTISIDFLRFGNFILYNSDI
jgi:hypothetical protein